MQGRSDLAEHLPACPSGNLGDDLGFPPQPVIWCRMNTQVSVQIAKRLTTPVMGIQPHGVIG